MPAVYLYVSAIRPLIATYAAIRRAIVVGHFPHIRTGRLGVDIYRISVGNIDGKHKVEPGVITENDMNIGADDIESSAFHLFAIYHIKLVQVTVFRS